MGELIEEDFDGQHNSESIVAYQYSDLQSTAKAILAKATETANKKIEQAKKNIAELEEIMRKQGYDKGFADGLVQGEIEGRKTGEAAARSEFEARIGGLNGALQHILSELSFRRQTIQAQAEADMLALALEIAKKIVKREVEVDEKFVVPLIMEAVALTNKRNDLVIKVNPANVKAVEEEIPTLNAIFNDIGRVSISADESIEAGGIKVISRDGEVDLSLEEQFASLERALVGDTKGMREWDGKMLTPLPQVDDIIPEPAAAVEAPAPAQTQDAPASSDQTAADQAPPAPAADGPKATRKSKIEPSKRRRGPRVASRKAPGAGDKPAAEATPQAAQPEVKESNVSDNTTVHSSVDPALQSSLSGVTDLSGLTLPSAEEAIIKEVLDSNVGEQDD